jgi:hypothetical protein
VKRAEVVKAGSVKVTPLSIEAFTEAEEKSVRIEKITKQKIREAAEELGLSCHEDQLRFAKKICTYLMKKR